MNLKKTNRELKERLSEYRLSNKGVVISTHINAIDIATSLIDYALEDGREILVQEKIWFEASYYLSFVLSGSEWEDLSDTYSDICDYLNKINFKFDALK